MRGPSSTGHTAEPAEYWDRVVGGWSDARRVPLWRRHSDRVNGALLARWRTAAVPIARALKTDLFDEAVGEGLVDAGALGRTRSTIGIDLAAAAVTRAVGRHPQLEGLVADVRRLPFRSGSFDLVVSTSTLDHFRDPRDLAAALAELHRVLRREGELIITMDNTANPVVALRGRVQAPFLRLGLLPYFTGVSCDARGLRALLTDAGFDVPDQATVLHVPRVPAMVVARLLDTLDRPRLSRAYLRLLAAFERLAATRLAPLTGYFVGARAIKR